MKYMKEAKRSNMKIGVGSIVTAKIEEMEEKTREGISRRTNNEAMCCVKAMVGKKKFILQFKDRKK